MRKRTIFIILLFSLIFDIQRVSAATTSNLHTDKIVNVMDENNKHVFIGVNENA